MGELADDAIAALQQASRHRNITLTSVPVTEDYAAAEAEGRQGELVPLRIEVTQA